MSTPNRPRTRSSSITRSRSLGRAAKISSAAPSHPAIPPPSVEQDIEYINSFLPPTLPDIEESLEEPPSQDIEESLEESPSQGLTKATLSTIYKPSEIASLTTSYTRLRASTNHWPVLRHSNSAAIRMKRGSLGNNSRIWGSATGEINCTPKHAMEFVMDHCHPTRLEINKKSDLARRVIEEDAPTAHTKIFYGVKRLPQPWTARQLISKWTYFRFPDGRIVITANPTTHPSYPETPDLVRAKFFGSIYLQPLGMGGHKTLMLLIVAGDPGGSFPLFLYNATLAISLTLVAETKNYFSDHHLHSGKRGHSSFVSPQGEIGSGHNDSYAEKHEDLTSSAEVRDDMIRRYGASDLGVPYTPTFVEWFKIRGEDSEEKHEETATVEADTEFRCYQASSLFFEPMEQQIRRNIVLGLILTTIPLTLSSHGWDDDAGWGNETTNPNSNRDYKGVITPLYFLLGVAPWIALGVFRRRNLLKRLPDLPKAMQIESIMISVTICGALSLIFLSAFFVDSYTHWVLAACSLLKSLISTLTLSPLTRSWGLRIFYVETTTHIVLHLANMVEFDHKNVGVTLMLMFVCIDVFPSAIRKVNDDARTDFFKKFDKLYDLFKYEIRALQDHNMMTPEQQQMIKDIVQQVRHLMADPESPLDLKEISPHHIEFVNKIGNGKFGLVFSARYKSRNVAVKQVIPEMVTMSTVMSFVGECHILSRLKHRNVAECVGVMLRPTQICLVVEFASVGNLRLVLRETKNLTWRREKKNILLQVCSGMQYLHSMDIIHRDIKAENILVTEDWVIKITDFGLARFRGRRSYPAAGPEEEDEKLKQAHSYGNPLSSSNPHSYSNPSSVISIADSEVGMSHMIGTPLYMAPEVIMSQCDDDYDEKVDVFSFGMMLADVAYDGHLHTQIPAFSSAEWTKKVAAGWRFDLPLHWKQDIPLIVSIIERCLAQKSSDRPSFGALKKILRKWDGELDDRMSESLPMQFTHITQNEVEFFERIARIMTKNTESRGSLYSELKSSDPETTMTMRLAPVDIDGKLNNLHIGRAVRKIPFKSFEVLNWLWGWMDPSRVALNKATRESERSIVEEINEHHRIVSSTKEFRDVLGGMLVDPRQAVLRTMWKETHPRTYVMATESCEHERMPVVPGVVRAYLVCGFTVSPTPDGGCEVDYAISVNPKGSLPFVVSKMGMNENLLVLNDCYLDLLKRGREEGGEDGDRGYRSTFYTMDDIAKDSVWRRESMDGEEGKQSARTRSTGEGAGLLESVDVEELMMEEGMRELQESRETAEIESSGEPKQKLEQGEEGGGETPWEVPKGGGRRERTRRR